MKSANSRKARWGAIPYVVWMALFTVAPLILITVYAFSNAEGSFTVEHFTGLLDYVGIFSRSLGLAAVATVISLLIGYPIAYFISKEKVWLFPIYSVSKSKARRCRQGKRRLFGMLDLRLMA